MKKRITKKSMVISAVALLLVVAVGTTLAYVFTNTNSVKNTFTPSKVSCAVVENDSKTEYSSGTVSTATKTNVKIKNTGDTDAYIRVAVVVNWASADGTKVWATKPASGDYTINYATDTEWVAGKDGFYYFKEPVAAGKFTDILISSAKQNVTGPVGTDNTQYYLSIEIVASAIQSTPTNVVEEQWGVKVDNDGNISK